MNEPRSPSPVPAGEGDQDRLTTSAAHIELAALLPFCERELKAGRAQEMASVAELHRDPRDDLALLMA